MFLTRLSLKRPIFATVVILALLTLGTIGYFNLNINDWPEVEMPYVAVTIIEPGALPDHLESRVARPVEDALGQIAGVKHIMTRIQENVVLIYVEFPLEVGVDTAAQKVREKIGAIKAELPEEVKEPIITQFNPQAAPIMSLAVSGSGISEREMSSWVDNTLRPQLETISGVGSVQVSGLKKREIQVMLDKERMSSVGITCAEVVGSIRQQNLDVPSGSTLGSEGQMAVRSSGERKSLADLKGIPIGVRGGNTIFLGDVASIEDGLEESEETVLFQGRPAIGIDIIKQSGSNTVQVADKVRAVLDSLQDRVPRGLELDILRDNSQNIRDSLADVQRTLLEGALLAVLTVLIFLKDWRSTLISALAIPTSIISAFWVMNILDFTLNTVSLVALSLSVGLLIDDAIVVIENIYRHWQMGKAPLIAVEEATAQVGLAVTATTLAVVSVFLPVGMMSGVAGQYFKEFGITVVVAVLVSLLVAFTLVPLIASRVLRDEGDKSNLDPFAGLVERFNQGFEDLSGKYVQSLDLVLKKYRWQVLIAAALFFGGSLLILPLLPSSFITTADGAEFTIVADMDAGLNLNSASEITSRIEAVAKTHPEVIKTYSVTKKDEARIYVGLSGKRERKHNIFDIAQSLRQDLAAIPGARTSILIKDFSNIENKNVEYRLLGEDSKELLTQAVKLTAIMKSMPGTVDVSSSFKPGNPEQRLEVRHQVAADLGISSGLIADTLRTMYTGTVVGGLADGNHRYNIRVRLPESQRQAGNALTGIYLPTTGKDGTPVLVDLKQLVEPVFASAPGEIRRFDRSREITLSCNLYGISPGKFEKAFMNKIEREVQLPPGYRIIAGSYSEAMADSDKNMTLAFITAIIFIFFVMAANFESFIDPLAIMMSLPLAIIGAILGLFFSGSELSLISSIGFIMLMGLVTKNAILLIDFAKQQIAQGLERHTALLQAAATRVRPIIMTSTAMVFGMLPLALALGTGSETRSPMAHAIIGGLISSTFLTLFVVPILYTLLDDARQRLFKRSGGNRED